MVVWPATVRPKVRAVKAKAPRIVATRFKVSRKGVVTQIRFYKARANKGRHTGSIWDARGRRLAVVRFTNESRSGWQSARLARPLHVAPGRTYTVGYTARRGRWSVAPQQFAGRQLSRGPLTAFRGAIGRLGSVPKATARAFYVDVAFRPKVSGSSGTAATSGYPGPATTGAGSLSGSRAGGTVTKAGTTIANTVITGQLTVRAANVTLRNVEIRPGGSYGLLTYGKNTRIVNSTIRGSGRTLAGIAAYEGGTVHADGVDVSGVEDGVRLAHNSSLTNSYVHDLRGSSSSHYDAVTADGYRGWVIRHNTIVNPHGQTAAVWIGDPRYGGSEGVLADNLLAGGGYTVYAGPGAGAGLRVTNNAFSTRIHPKSGYWGPVTSWSRAGNTWSGNVWLDGARAGTAVSP